QHPAAHHGQHQPADPQTPQSPHFATLDGLACMTGRNAPRPAPASTAITSNSRSRLSGPRTPILSRSTIPHADRLVLHPRRFVLRCTPGDSQHPPVSSPHPPVSAGQFTVPATVL